MTAGSSARAARAQDKLNNNTWGRETGLIELFGSLNVAMQFG